MQKHPFHLVDPSPWPLFCSFAAFVLTTGGVLYMHSYWGGFYLGIFGLFMVLYGMAAWWRDVIREGTYEGHHTLAVQRGLRYGVLLFILSEVLFFGAFFWAFFHSSLSPTVDIGAVWPPKGIEVLDPWSIPFLNTIILLTSGGSVTWAHHGLVAGKRKETLFAFFCTILLAFIFTGFQGYEYLEAPFTISDGIYGSTFYMATGFHGFHVFIGTLFLTVMFYRYWKGEFTQYHHFGFEAAAWYWHMVDVIWLFLFVAVYYWGGR